MTSRKPLGAAEIEEINALAGNHYTTWESDDKEAAATYLLRLLSLLTQAKIEANILSRVIDVMGYSGDYQLIPERLASMLTPPPDADVREAVEE